MRPSGWMCWNLPFSSFRGAPQLRNFGCWHLPRFIRAFAGGAAQNPPFFFFSHLCTQNDAGIPQLGTAQLCSWTSFTHCSQKSLLVRDAFLAAHRLPWPSAPSLGVEFQVKWQLSCQEQPAGSRLDLPRPCHPAAAPWANICSGKCLALPAPRVSPWMCLSRAETRLVLLFHSQGMFGLVFLTISTSARAVPSRPSLASGEVRSQLREQGCIPSLLLAAGEIKMQKDCQHILQKAP